MFQFELNQHIDEIRTDNLVYEKGGVIKHFKAPARVRDELPDLGQNEICAEVEKRDQF